MINETFERELQNTSINGISLADYVKENYIIRSENPNKWIPITVSMPELGVKVLVQRDRYGESNFDIGYYDGHYEREYWHNGTKYIEKVPHWWYFGGRLSDENPIAWMPLPKPYKPTKSEVE